MDETLRALEERAKEYRKDPVDIAMLKASRERRAARIEADHKDTTQTHER